MKHNKGEKKAYEWLVQNGLAKGIKDLVTVFPDIYIISSRKFIEVKMLSTPKYGKKRIYISNEQYAQFERLNPWMLIMDYTSDEPVWQGHFKALIEQLDPSSYGRDLPFQLNKYRQRQ